MVPAFAPTTASRLGEASKNSNKTLSTRCGLWPVSYNQLGDNEKGEWVCLLRGPVDEDPGILCGYVKDDEVGSLHFLEG